MLPKKHVMSKVTLINLFSIMYFQTDVVLEMPKTNSIILLFATVDRI